MRDLLEWEDARRSELSEFVELARLSLEEALLRYGIKLLRDSEEAGLDLGLRNEGMLRDWTSDDTVVEKQELLTLSKRS